MESRAKLLGHPLHQILIVFPMGLFATAVIFDVLYLAFNHDATLWAVSYWMIAAGIVGALVAAPFGLVDWLAIPSGTRAKRIGLMHGLGNLIVLGLFIGSFLMRRSPVAAKDLAAFSLSFIAGALAIITGWLGGELVVRHGIGVQDGAEPDAPSSLKTAPIQRN